MSMRRQLYEWQINRQTNGYTWPSPTVGGVTFEQIAGIPFSIFTGGIGNNITEPAATKATQFIAIDNIRCSPSFFLSGAAVTTLYKTLGGPAGAAGIATGLETNPANPGNIVNSPNPTYTPNGGNAPELTFQTTHVNPFTSIAGPLMFMQVLINTTSYFDETDGTVGPGLPGSASPCPETASCRSTFDFESPIYILLVNNGMFKSPFTMIVGLILVSVLQLIHIIMQNLDIMDLKTSVAWFNTLFTTVLMPLSPRNWLKWALQLDLRM